MNKDKLHDQTYLGDGVYAGHDGYHVVLWLESTGAYGPNAIALEPELIQRLSEYQRRLYARPTTSEGGSDDA
jgi:hypothetical protein